MLDLSLYGTEGKMISHWWGKKPFPRQRVIDLPALASGSAWGRWELLQAGHRWPQAAQSTAEPSCVVLPWSRRWEYLCTNAKIAQYINKNNITVLTPEGLLVLISGTWMATWLQDTPSQGTSTLGAWGPYDVPPWLSWRLDHSSTLFYHKLRLVFSQTLHMTHNCLQSFIPVVILCSAPCEGLLGLPMDVWHLFGWGLRTACTCSWWIPSLCSLLLPLSRVGKQLQRKTLLQCQAGNKNALAGKYTNYLYKYP